MIKENTLIIDNIIQIVCLKCNWIGRYPERDKDKLPKVCPKCTGVSEWKT